MFVRRNDDGLERNTHFRHAPAEGQKRRRRKRVRGADPDARVAALQVAGDCRERRCNRGEVERADEGADDDGEKG